MSFPVRVLALIALLCAARLVVGDDDHRAQRMAYLDNGIIKVGVDLDRGGSIGFLADVKKGGNVVNVHDLGRWIGQSYYSGPRPFGDAHPGWKEWPWNPVSAGDVYGHPSKLLDQTNDGKTLYVKSIPQQWALDNVAGDCTFETWITLDARAVHVRNRLTNQRRDVTQYPAMDQELPALYTIGRLHRLVTYTGDSPFADKPLEEIPRRPSKDGRAHWSTFFATERWAALVDDDDWGLGVIQPVTTRFLGGFHGKPGAGGPDDDPCGYIAPVGREILDHDIVYEYCYTLVLDTLANIRREACKQRPEESVPDYRFAKHREHWWFLNVEDTGFPIHDCLRLKVEKDDPQLFGPEAFWQARDVPTIFVRAAFRTAQKTAVIFWETAETRGFPPAQSVTFPVVPDGKVRTYEVKLSSSAAYRGTIRRLRFDPVGAGRPGETVDLFSISAGKD